MGTRGPSSRVVSRNRLDVASSYNDPKPKPEPAEPPEDLSDAAKTWWMRLIVPLTACEAVATLDLTALRLLCQSLAEIDACEAVLSRDGLTTTQTNKAGATNLVPHPLIRVRNAAKAQAVQLLKCFAAVPSVRGVRGLDVSCRSDADDEESNVAKILGIRA